MKTLESLLGETSIEVFFDKYFTRMPLAVPGKINQNKIQVDWDKISKIIDSKKSYLRIVKDGRMTKDYADVSFEEAKKFYLNGHTLLIKNAELSDEDFLSLRNEFSNFFRTPVDIQLYCTPDKNNAFGWHYDVEEVFIVQIKGSKEYTIRQNTIHPYPVQSSVPNNMEYEKEKSEIQLKVLLKEGDFLYIPSGWWHIAHTQLESMHISIGGMPRTALDIFSHLETFLSQSLFWRNRMPVHHEFKTEEEAVLFYQDAMSKLGRDLQNHVSSREFILSFLAKQKNF